MAKTQAHTRYYNKAGVRLPGVTTIVDVMNKPHLVTWANAIGLNGIDVNKYVDDLASVGTLVHYLAECEVGGMLPEAEVLRDYSANDIDRAETCLIKLYEWEKSKEHTVIPEVVERPLVSETHQYGGTIDLYGRMADKNVLIDIKTCKALHGPADEKWTQLAGYKLLLEENGFPVDAAYILRLGRSEDEGFEFALMPKPDLQEKRFLACLNLYRIGRQLDKREEP